jgi:hypothetical protein
MTIAPAITYVWLYLAEGSSQQEGALAQLARALSIPSEQVFAGDAVQTDDYLRYAQSNTLLHFPLHGDFAYSCDIKLMGWTLLAVEAALTKLSASGLTVAMLDNTNASPFACLLFQAGSHSAITVVVDDDTCVATVYSALGV